MIIRFLDQAAAELDDAVAYYESVSPGLGAAFALQVNQSLARISKHPNAWHPLGLRTRRCRLSRFPYGLIYAIRETEIVIVAVMHLHRRPDYWRDRSTHR